MEGCQSELDAQRLKQYSCVAVPSFDHHFGTDDRQLHAYTSRARMLEPYQVAVQVPNVQMLPHLVEQTCL